VQWAKVLFQDRSKQKLTARPMNGPADLQHIDWDVLRIAAFMSYLESYKYYVDFSAQANNADVATAAGRRS
jgi:hypothetical protein